MSEAEGRDCIQTCPDYGTCFDLATKERDPFVSQLFETIMNSGDGCQLAGRGGENCAIKQAARAVIEICRDVGVTPEESVLKYYVELFDENRTGGGDREG